MRKCDAVAHIVEHEHDKSIEYSVDSTARLPIRLILSALFSSLALCSGCTRTLDIMVVDGATGTIVPNASMDKEEFVNGMFSPAFSDRVSKLYAHPGADGIFHIVIPTNGTEYFIIATSPGYVSALSYGIAGSFWMNSPVDVNTTNLKELYKAWFQQAGLISAGVKEVNLDKLVVIPLYKRATTRPKN